MRAIIPLALFSAACCAQTAFDVAAVKPSRQHVGPDYRKPIVTYPDKLTGQNVTLKDLIATAWRVERYQITGGPRWLDSDEFDVEARAAGPVSRDRLGLMLQALLADKFHLAVHNDSRDARVFVLETAGQRPVPPDDAPGGSSLQRFRGDMHRLAELLSVQLSIPTSSDPSRPGVAGAPVPVIDKTGLTGVYDFVVDIRPEPGADMLVLWQRILRDQLGLKLEGQKAKVDFVVVDRADRIPELP